MATEDWAIGSRRRRGSGGVVPFRWLAAVVAAAAAALIVVPVSSLVIRFARGDVDFALFTQLWTDVGLRSMLVSTILVVLGSTLLAGVVGSLFAWLNERTDARMGWLSQTLPVLPLMVPPLAGTIGWILLASPRVGFLNAAVLRPLGERVGITFAEGPLNIYSWYGLVFVYVMYLVPHVYLTVVAALRNLDSSLEEASQVSGASSFRTFRSVTMPAIAPSIAGGVLLAMVIGFALFSVPVLIGATAGIEILSVRIVRAIITTFPPDFQTAIVLGAVMVLFVGAAWIVQARLTRANRHATIGGRGARARTMVKLGRWRPAARGVMLLYILLASVLPLAALLIVSLQNFWRPTIVWEALSASNYASLWDQTYTRTALRNSIVLGVSGATLGMLTAAVIAYFIRRSRTAAGRVVDGVTKLPGAISNVVLAMGFVAAFVGPPFRLGGTLLILLGGYMALYMPQASVTASSALFQVDRSMSEASFCSGASEGRTFGRIVLPLMRPGLIAGWMFLFVLMAGDVTASVMLASTRTPVVGFVMLDLFNNGIFPRLAAMGVVVSLLTSSVILSAVALASLSRRRGTRQAEDAAELPASVELSG